jgi:hypothetical protein
MGGEPRRVDGTRLRYHRGVNAINKIGHSFCADSVPSCSTYYNRTGGYYGGTPCRYDSPMPKKTHLVLSLVHTAAAEASLGIVLRRIGIRHVGLG